MRGLGGAGGEYFFLPRGKELDLLCRKFYERLPNSGSFTQESLMKTICASGKGEGGENKEVSFSWQLSR